MSAKEIQQIDNSVPGAPGPPGGSLSRDEAARYQRHLLLPEFGMDGQLRLREARVLVVGAGGLGAPVLTYLAAAGVGTIGILDDDLVELSNLQRQVIFGESDLGSPKVLAAARRLREINPHVTVEERQVRVDSTNALELFQGYDLIVDGSDNFATRYLVNDACVILGLPCVWGSVLRFEGQVSVFWEQRGPQYRDLYPDPPPPGLVPSCAEGGVLGVLCAMIGSAMAAEAIKVITGVGDPLLGRLLLLDGLSATWREFPITAQPDTFRPSTLQEWDYAGRCGLAEPAPDPGLSISAAELRDLLGDPDAGETFVLVDVREPAEHEMQAIPRSVLIPKARLRDQDQLDYLRGFDVVILYCASGIRSRAALETLRAAGFDGVKTLTGGIRSWATVGADAMR